MAVLHNRFKAALKGSGAPRIGLFLGLGSAYTADLLGDTGFDWLLIDGEHGPNDVRSILPQLQALAAHEADTLVRMVDHDAARIKQLLDIGVQTLLVPMVNSVDEARALVAATRYPPVGIRGIAPALARGARWGGIPDYLEKANDEVCLIVQAESSAALESLDDILAVDGVDGVFIGPSDLAASMGYVGQPRHPQVQTTALEAIDRIARSGKAAGAFAPSLETAREFCQAGARFVAIGADAVLLRQAADALVKAFHQGDAAATGVGY